ncbi:MAG: MBL fold metallo-hydrolase [Chloroflexota bacterium]|nr:MBL fold metallo-hydrolase [Chloroflexota bacterium]
MRVTSLGSGSSGNALLVEAGPHGRTRILIDAGLSSRILIERLQQAGTHPKQLQGVLVTHEHIDHVSGLPVLMKRYGIPAISAPATLAALQHSFASGIWPVDSGALVTTAAIAPLLTKLDLSENEEVSLPGIDPNIALPEVAPESGMLLPGEGKPVVVSTIAMQLSSRRLIGDIEVVSFPVSHDAVAPSGYLITAGGCRICIAIDSGEVTPTMLEAMHHADLLILESNHDRERLIRGPYPYALKQRILGPTGHLSNDQAADAVLQTWRTDSVRWLWLSHLSRTNNTPKIALQSMIGRLEKAGANLAQIHVSVSAPGMGHVWDSAQLWHEPSLWEMQH